MPHLPKSGRRFLSVVLALLSLWSASALAQPPTPRISLLTFAPGEIYWQRYGHNALLVHEPGREPLVYNYGIFDFRQKNFFLNFARGRMLYRLAAQPLGEALYPYQLEGRWVYEQPLVLDEPAARELAAFLRWNAQPENAEYRYDYFHANCSTRVRDALDRALGGRLQAVLSAQDSGRSWRFEATRLMSPDLALTIGIDALLGPATDRVMNRWQQSFLPLTLSQGLEDLRHADGRPVVSSPRLLLTAREHTNALRAPALNLPFLAAGLLLAAALCTLRARAARVLATLVAGVSGLGGVLLLLGVTLTDHAVMKGNLNLLLFSPLALALLRPLWRGERTPLAHRLTALNLLLALLALLIFLITARQAHLHWILFWLPLHAALAWRLHRRAA